MKRLMGKARSEDFDVDPATRMKIMQICTTSVWGFREIVLVMTIGRLLDPAYSPTTSLYKCNPRAIYEGPIRAALREAGIPHRKSGPLNIAKATAGINEAWAAQRQPREVAQVVLELAEQIEGASSSEVEHLAIALLAELLAKAERVKALSISVPEEADISYLVHLCWRMINEVPDAGNTPQRIVGLLLEVYHESIGSGVQVSGHEDRASVTSTTSKKPGDIMERTPSGDVLSVCEVTVKPFDDQRTMDSLDAVRAFAQEANQMIPEIWVICREQDVHPSATWTEDGPAHIATLFFEGLTYEFAEIHHWVTSALCSLGPGARVEFYNRFNDYVSEPNTSEEVKRYWRQLHEGNT